MPKQYLRGWATVFFGTKYIPSTRHRLKMIGKPLLRALWEIDKNNFASEEIKAGILKIGINKCARESGFDRKNFIRKLVHGIPDVATVLPFEIGICLFRVLQEALHNIVKHSGVKCVDVRLTEHSNQIHLRVSDSGKGFDVESTMQSKGLGLTSMRERVRLVNGPTAIDSKPMGGTTIEVRVPLESQQASQRAL